MATKLGIFRAALHDVGGTEVSDTGEPVEAARVLNSRYADVVSDCLEAGQWNFATETVMVDSDTGITPAFGYTKVFAKPTDWVRTIAVSADPYFSAPLTTYDDDKNYWSADDSPIYVRYISNDTGMGLDLTRWPRSFTRFVELELACRVCERLTQNGTQRAIVEEKRDREKRNALNKDALNEAQPKFFPQGSWTTARSGGSSRERGSRGRLIG